MVVSESNSFKISAQYSRDDTTAVGTAADSHSVAEYSSSAAGARASLQGAYRACCTGRAVVVAAAAVGPAAVKPGYGAATFASPRGFAAAARAVAAVAGAAIRTDLSEGLRTVAVASRQAEAGHTHRTAVASALGAARQAAAPLRVHRPLGA